MENDNTLIRSAPCPECGSQMLWTQAAWAVAGRAARAAYQCLNGHIIDPERTPQCPGCGIHDTAPTGTEDEFRCERCGQRFPRRR